MKIIAHFDSPDSADFAAGAVKNAISPLSSIETKDHSARKNKDIMNLFTAYNTASTSPTYSMPMLSPAAFSASRGYNTDSSGDDHVLEVVCRREDAAKASRIIIGYGGRNISRLN
ncbi:MAG: hypothetical protein K2H23_05475, partial [Oscillospiraceae bacterium]|nr:hypothetical protein [Oscillospiraceae bacterium]